MILGDFTDKTRNDDSIVEIVVEQTSHLFNNEWYVKSFSECSLLFLLKVARGRPFTLPHDLPALKTAKARIKIQLLVASQAVATPKLLEQQDGSRSSTVSTAATGASLPRIASISTGTGEAGAPTAERERRRNSTR